MRASSQHSPTAVLGRAPCAPARSGVISPPQTGHATRRRAQSPSQTSTITSSSSRLASQREAHLAVQRRPATYDMLLIRPTTLPSTRTSRLRIGSMESFSGCSRTWSSSRKKRLTVASSPTSATTMSPSLGLLLGPHHDQVVLEDADVLHRVAAHPKQIFAVLAARRTSGSGRSPRCSPPPGSADRRQPGRPAAARDGRGSAPRPPRGRAARSRAAWSGRDAAGRSARGSTRCACTVEDEASPTALPMSRTVGG